MSEYENFKVICDEIDSLIKIGATSSDLQFKEWRARAERFLLKKYGLNSSEYDKFQKIIFFPTLLYTGCDQDTLCKNACKKGLESAKAYFMVYLEEIQNEGEVAEMTEEIVERSFDKVFIVYGHEDGLKKAVARMLERQDISPILLDEQVIGGKTIIEQLEECTDVPAAICLFTADDSGGEKSEINVKPRARQNVVFEAGLLMGKLGRKNLIIIADSGVEMPSDLSGVLYIDKDNWELSVIKELKAIGYSVDANV